MSELPPISGPKGPAKPDTTAFTPIRDRILTIDPDRAKYTNAALVDSGKDRFTFGIIKGDSNFTAYLAVKNYNIDIFKKATAVVFDVAVHDVPSGRKPDLSVFVHVIGGGARENFSEDISGKVISSGNNKYSAIIEIRPANLHYYREYATFPETFRIEAVRISGGPQFPAYITVKNILVEK